MPGVIVGKESAIRTLEQLDQLASRVYIAVSCSKDTITIPFGVARCRYGVRTLCDQVMKPTRGQVARNVLCKAAPCGRDPVRPGDGEF